MCCAILLKTWTFQKVQVYILLQILLLWNFNEIFKAFTNFLLIYILLYPNFFIIHFELHIHGSICNFSKISFRALSLLPEKHLTCQNLFCHFVRKGTALQSIYYENLDFLISRPSALCTLFGALPANVSPLQIRI